MRVGPYEILGELGRGGAGVVYRARSPSGAVVAVKMIQARSASASQRVGRERRLQEDVGSEDGFVPLLDSGEHAGSTYLVMPLLEGGTLRKRLERAGRLPLDEALALVRTLAEAMGRAHARGIVHRDLKPDNVLFTSDGKPLIADLGLAKHVSSDASTSVILSKTGEFRGTAGYAPPEQMNDARSADARADVFALGAILYECLAGKPAFQADTLPLLVVTVATGRVDSLRGENPAVPTSLEKVVLRALDPDPAKRFEDAGAFARALDVPLVPEGRSRVPLVLGALVVAVAAAGIIGATSLRRSEGRAIAPPQGPTRIEKKTPPPVKRTDDLPGWYLAQPESLRAARPLPAGVKFGERPGEFVNEKDGSLLVHVPAGVFVHGLGTATPERRSVPAFFIGKLEVTVKQFARFVAETKHRTTKEEDGSSLVYRHARDEIDQWGPEPGASWRDPDGDGVAPPEDEPVVHVTIADALAYARWAGADLPRDDAWEKAAEWDPVTGETFRWPWGSGPEAAPPARALANLFDRALREKVGDPEARDPSTYEDGFVRRAPVGSFARDRSPVGALDMAGNVSEWCLAEHTDENAVIGVRVVRGASWASDPSSAQPANSKEFPLTYASAAVGFRIARPAR